MAKLSRVAGSTSHVLTLFIQDSSSTTGAGLTGLAFGSSGLTCYYKRNSGTASVAVTLVTITTLGTYASGGFKEVDATNMPGVYEFHPPDAAYASGAKSVVLMLKGATNMAPVPIEVELTGWDNQDAVHGGMSALPNTACTTNASLLTSGTGTDQVSVSAGKTLLQATQTGVTIPTVTAVTNAVVLPTGTGAGQISLSSGTVTVGTNNDKTGYTASTVSDKTGYSLTQTFPTNFSSLAVTVGGAVTAGTVSDKTGYSLAASQHVIVDSGTVTTLTNLPTAPTDWLTAAAVQAAAVTKIQAGLATPTNITAGTITTVTTLTNLPSIPAGWLTAAGIAAAALNGKGDWNTTTPPTSAVIAAAVVDLATSGHTTSGTFGAAIVAAGGSGDPWSTSIPGSYGAGTAGYILGGHLTGKVAATLAAADVTGLLPVNVLDVNSLPAAPQTLALDGSGNVTVGTNLDKTGYGLAASQHVIVDSGTVTTLTNLPAAPTDWLAAAAVSAAAVTKVQAGLSTFAGGPVASVTAPVTTGTVGSGAISSASFTVGTVNASATGVLERLMLLVWRFFPQGSGKVTQPSTVGAGSQTRVYGSNGTTVIANQPSTDDGTTQTLGPAS